MLVMLHICVSRAFFLIKNNMQRQIKFKIDNKEKFEIDDSGFLRCNAFVTRAGIFNYIKDGKRVKELRPKEEVFSEDSLKTLKTLPITKEHPDSFVNSENVKDVLVGVTGENFTKTDDFASIPVTIYDGEIVKDIIGNHEKGIGSELSCGYKAKIDETPGSSEFGFHDSVQKNIRYNHVSLVQRGRAGHEVKLILDNNKETGIVKYTKKAIKVDGFTMDEINEDIKEDISPLVNKLSVKLDEAVKVICDLNDSSKSSVKKFDELQAKADQATDEIEKLKSDLAELSDPNSDRVKKLIKDKTELYSLAKKLEIKVDEKKDKDIKLDVIKSKFPDFKSDDKSDEYVNARFDGTVELIKLDEEAKGDKGVGEARKDGTAGKPVDHKAKFIKDSENFWKPKE